MPKLPSSDILIVLRGLNAVSKAAASVTEAELKEAWTASSGTRSGLKSLFAVNFKPENFSKHVKEATERSFAVVKGLQEYSVISAQQLLKKNSNNVPDSYQESQQVLEYENQRLQPDVESTHHILNNLDNTVGPSVLPEAEQMVVNEELSKKSSVDLTVPSNPLPVKKIQNSLGKKITGIILKEDKLLSPSSTVAGASNGHSSISKLHSYSSACKMVSSNLKQNDSVVGKLKAKPSSPSAGQGNSKVNPETSSSLPNEPEIFRKADKQVLETEKGNLTNAHQGISDAASATTGDNELSYSHAVNEHEKGNSQTSHEPVLPPIPPVAKKNRKSKLSETSREVPVPSSRVGRLASYGSLAAGLGIGALAEVTRRTLGLSGKKMTDENMSAVLDSNLFLTEANAERIVKTLCKVRGAALKLGQMLSIQDNSLINPQLLKIFERVRESADFMPIRQMESVLNAELGPDWRSRFLDFQDKPFAAASVGQVHSATLLDGREVAMKIQYPGVAKGIESDINNLVAVMNVWDILPKGMYVEEFITVAKRELSWEVDYVREAECTKKFAELLKDMPQFKIPDVIDELCTGQVFTSEFVEGISMEQCMQLDQETRNFVAENILSLCLTEVFQFRFMQTDPNWANFMYNPVTRQVVLIDFGASREYSKEFVDKYIQIIEGAAEGDRKKVLEFSRAAGFLIGYETKVMEEAHVEAVMILGEAFRYDKPFDFGSQDTTRRIQKLIPVMLSHRLCPPPQETYSLHRKMSGAFLLCGKLGANINCKKFFDDIIKKYHASGESQ